MSNTSNIPLNKLVKESLQKYFSCIDEISVGNIYTMVITEVEKPLIETVMEQTKGNQSKAAKWLGLNRGTLRKLLLKYNL